MPSWAVVAPRFLDPLLALAERLDRTARRLRPIRPDGILHLERRRHRGAETTLADGTVVRPRDRLGVLHFDNRRVREEAVDGWQTAGYREARRDLIALAAWHLAQRPDTRPVAYHGVTILAALTHRLGFEVRPRRQTAWTALEDWYLRSLLARWAGRERVAVRTDRPPLAARQSWISATELIRRYAGSA
jgi:YkoP domain